MRAHSIIFVSRRRNQLTKLQVDRRQFRRKLDDYYGWNSSTGKEGACPRFCRNFPMYWTLTNTKYWAMRTSYFSPGQIQQSSDGTYAAEPGHLLMKRVDKHKHIRIDHNQLANSDYQFPLFQTYLNPLYLSLTMKTVLMKEITRSQLTKPEVQNSTSPSIRVKILLFTIYHVDTANYVLVKYIW